MGKVKVTICEGTTCFVMGGEALRTMLTALMEKYQDKIEITSSRCLGACNRSDAFSKAPYVLVDDEMISSADIEKVKETIERKIK